MKEFTGLEQYIERVKDSEDKSIYYLSGEDEITVKHSPFLKTAKEHDIEVLLLTDPLDEYVVQHLPNFQGFTLKALDREGSEVGKTLSSKLQSKYKAKLNKLTTWLKTELKGEVDKVSVASQINEEHAVVKAAQYGGHSAQMERMMKAQALGSDAQRAPRARKVLELNPRSPIVKELSNLIESETNSAKAKDLAWLLYDAALVNSGFDISNTQHFVSSVFNILKDSMHLKSLNAENWVEEEGEEEEEEEVEQNIQEKEEL